MNRDAPGIKDSSLLVLGGSLVSTKFMFFRVLFKCFLTDNIVVLTCSGEGFRLLASQGRSHNPC